MLEDLIFCVNKNFCSFFLVTNKFEPNFFFMNKNVRSIFLVTKNFKPLFLFIENFQPNFFGHRKFSTFTFNTVKNFHKSGQMDLLSGQMKKIGTSSSSAHFGSKIPYSKRLPDFNKSLKSLKCWGTLQPSA